MNRYTWSIRVIGHKMNIRLHPLSSVTHPHPQTAFYGLTGHVKFDDYGLRTNYSLDVLEVNRKGGMDKVNCINSFPLDKLAAISLTFSSAFLWMKFLAATKQLYEWYFLSVCPSVTPFWLCSHHRIIMKFSGVITKHQGKVMQKVKVRGQRSTSQRSRPNLTVSGL